MTLSLHCTPLVLGITRGVALQYFLCPARRLLVAFHPRSHTASMWALVTQLHVQNPSSSGPCGIGYSCMWPLPRSYGQADLINRIASHLPTRATLLSPLASLHVGGTSHVITDSTLPAIVTDAPMPPPPTMTATLPSEFVTSLPLITAATDTCARPSSPSLSFPTSDMLPPLLPLFFLCPVCPSPSPFPSHESADHVRLQVLGGANPITSRTKKNLAPLVLVVPL
jgi:hypothetical protein